MRNMQLTVWRGPRPQVIARGATVLTLVILSVMPWLPSASGTAAADAAYGEDHRAFAAYAGISESEAVDYWLDTEAVAVLGQTARDVYPESFGGLYREPQQPDRVTLLFTRNADQAVTSLAARFRGSAELVGRIAPFSAAHLQSALDRVLSRIDASELRALRLASAYVDVPKNRVVVQVVEPTPSLRQSLADVDEAILVQDGIGEARLAVCQDRTACTPEMRGGVRIESVDYRCSSGFEATLAGESVLLTAGHCFEVGDIVNHSGIPIGQVEARNFNSLGDNDALRMSQNDSPLPGIPWQPSNWIYATNNTKQYFIGAVKAKFGENVGDPLCRAGQTTGRICGSVLAVNIVVQISNGPRLYGQNQANMCALPGDSGGPVYYSGFGHGMTSAASFTTDGQGQPACYPVGDSRRWMTYPPLAEAEKDLGVTVRRTSP